MRYMRDRLIAIYRAPGSNNMARLLECLSFYSNVKFNCIIVGDLNCPSIDWNLLKAKVPIIPIIPILTMAEIIIVKIKKTGIELYSFNPFYCFLNIYLLYF